MASKRKVESLTDKVKRYFRVKDSIARGYKRADKLEEELMLEMMPGVPVPLNEFENGVLADNYLDKSGKQVNTYFRTHKASRFELKRVKA